MMLAGSSKMMARFSLDHQIVNRFDHIALASSGRVSAEYWRMVVPRLDSLTVLLTPVPLFVRNGLTPSIQFWRMTGQTRSRM
jgi:hypothetical protein